MKRWGCFFFGVILVCLFVLGMAVPLEVVFHVGVGWCLFLANVVPRLNVSWSGFATAVVALGLFVAGFQRLATWCFAAVSGPDGRPLNGSWKWRWTLLATGAVLLFFVAGIAVVGVTHQVVWLSTSKLPFAMDNWDARRRSDSRNNLKRIGIALHEHADKHDRFPAGGTFDRLGRPMVSWQTALLPFLGEGVLFEQIHLELPWDASENSAAMARVVSAYQNRGVNRQGEQQFDASGRSLSHYAGNARVLGGQRAVSRSAFKDGIGQTIMAGEVNGRFKPWGYPVNWRDPSRGINRAPEGFGGPFTGGAHFLMGDGSVRFLSENTDAQVLEALATPDGGETVGDYD